MVTAAVRRRRSFPKLLALGLLFALLSVACTAEEEAQQSDDTSEVGGSAEPEPLGDFCAEADDFINDRSVTDVASFSADFFAEVESRLGRLVATAPPEVLGDLEALRKGFADSDEVFAEFDYDVTDQRLGPALDRVDNASMLKATDNIQEYLAEGCELDPVGSLDPEQVSDIMNSFGVDRPLAECLNLELGDVANIDPEELTPELMSKPVCGTSLLELLIGGQPTT